MNWWTLGEAAPELPQHRVESSVTTPAIWPCVSGRDKTRKKLEREQQAGGASALGLLQVDGVDQAAREQGKA